MLAHELRSIRTLIPEDTQIYVGFLLSSLHQLSKYVCISNNQHSEEKFLPCQPCVQL